MDARKLYTNKVNAYRSFISFFRSLRAYQFFFETSDLLKSDLHILDAGCGTGAATFALFNALQNNDLNYQHWDAFDLTPAMLDYFKKRLKEREISNIRIREGNVLHLDRLPSSWKNYDLIISTAMLEYIPKENIVTALVGLRDLLASGGRLIIAITKKNWVNWLLIEKWWKSNRYSRSELEHVLIAAGFEHFRFKRFHYTYFWQNQWGYLIDAQSKR